MRRILVIGHKGAAGSAPENTLKSFEMAYNMGADMIELDLQQTSDGYLVCIHDYEVSKTTNGEGLVHELTLAEIQSLDAGEGQTIPLLSEVLDLARGRLGVNIDLKVPGVEAELLSLVGDREMIRSVIFSSFFHGTLSEIRDISTEATTAVLFDTEIEDVATYAHDLRANAINPLFSSVNDEMVQAAHEKGLRVLPFTVNDEEVMRNLLHMGVDGIITDLPAIAARVVDSYLEQTKS